MVLHELKSYQGKYFDTMSSAINIVLRDNNINLHPYLDNFLLRTFAFQFDRNNPKLWFSPLINQIDSVIVFKELFASFFDIEINTIEYNQKQTVTYEIDKMLRLGSVILGSLDKSKIWNRIESLHYKGAAYYIVINESNENNYVINDPSGCPFMFLSKDMLLNSFCDSNKIIQLIQIKPVNPVFGISQSLVVNTLNIGISYRINLKENDLSLSKGVKSLLNNDFVFKSSQEAILNFAIPNYSIFLHHLNLFINRIPDSISFRKFYGRYNKYLAELLFTMQKEENKSIVLNKFRNIIDFEFELDYELDKIYIEL